MDVLASVQARVVTVASVVMSLGTIFTCYALAVKLGHVPAWLPMIRLAAAATSTAAGCGAAAHAHCGRAPVTATVPLRRRKSTCSALA